MLKPRQLDHCHVCIGGRKLCIAPQALLKYPNSRLAITVFSHPRTGGGSCSEDDEDEIYFARPPSDAQALHQIYVCDHGEF